MKLTDLVPPVFTKYLRRQAIVRALYLVRSGSAAWTKQDYAKLAVAGYQHNSMVHSCISLISRSGAGIPWLLYQRRRGKGTRVKLWVQEERLARKARAVKTELVELDAGHDLLHLIRRPNPLQGQALYLESVLAFLLLSGNSYQQRVGPESLTAPPKELYTLRPDRMVIVPSSTELVEGYKYVVAGREVPFVGKDRDRILHIRFFHPTDDYYGLSPVGVASRAVDMDNAADASNVALLQNGLQPSGAFVVQSSEANPKGVLTEEQFEKLEATIQSSSPERAGRTLLLEGGLDWRQIGLSPSDAAWLDGKKASGLAVCRIYNVPPEMAGLPEFKTYANFQEARRSLYTETVLPLMDLLRDEWNRWLVPLFGDNLYLDYDRDEIEALQEDREKTWQRIGQAWSDGRLKLNEAREAMGYEGVPEGDVIMTPPGRLPLGGLLDEFQGRGPGVKDDGLAAMVPVGLISDEQKTAYWKTLEARRARSIIRGARAVAGRFREESEAVRVAVQGSATLTAAALAADNAVDDEAWTQFYLKWITDLVVEYGKPVFDALEMDGREAASRQLKAWDPWAPAVQDFIAGFVARKVVNITTQTRKQIQGMVTLAQASGDLPLQLAGRLDTLYLEQIVPHRSIVIARTEVISSSNFGSQAGAKATGLRLEKEWISSRDDRNRRPPDSDYDHWAMDGVRVPMDQPYTADPTGKAAAALMGEPLMYPGDPVGSAGNVIQCRCTEGYHRIEEE